MRKKKLHNVADSRRFARFTKGRDAGLERVLAKYSHAVGLTVETLRTRSEEVAARMLLQNHHPGLHAHNRDTFEAQLWPLYSAAVERIAGLILSLRQTTYTLTAASQAYALARVLGQPAEHRKAHANLGAALQQPMELGGTVHQRVDLAVSRLLRAVVDAYQMNQVMGGTNEECLARITRAFPRAKLQKRPPRVMARLSEAAKPHVSVAGGQDPWDDWYTPEGWDEAVADYMEDELPYGRAPGDKVFYTGPVDEDGNFWRYQWQVEQEMTDDFVDAVRAGEDAAAAAQGITTFQWIAVIDAKTDRCCTTRDGKTVEEIEAGMDDGTVDTEDSEATVPPAHFNCRCRLAPMTDDMPEESGPDWASFDAWLEEKGRQ